MIVKNIPPFEWVSGLDGPLACPVCAAVVQNTDVHRSQHRNWHIELEQRITAAAVPKPFYDQSGGR